MNRTSRVAGQGAVPAVLVGALVLSLITYCSSGYRRSSIDQQAFAGNDSQAFGGVQLSPAFKSGIVLNAERPRLFGTGVPGSTIVISSVPMQTTTTPDAAWEELKHLVSIQPSSAVLKGEPYKVKANGAGEWEIEFEPQTPGNTEFSLYFNDGLSQTYAIDNVVFGHVLLCAGQSNNQVPVSYLTNGKELLAEAPKYEKQMRLTKTPIETEQMYFTSASAHAASNFSGLCYGAAVRLIELMPSLADYAVPIGIVSAVKDGSPIAPFFTSNKKEDLSTKCWDMSKEKSASKQWNAKLKPFAGMTFTAAIFYQGESDSYNVSAHVDLWPCYYKEMVRQWREAFRDPTLPFVTVPIAQWNTSSFYPYISLSTYNRIQQFAMSPGRSYLSPGGSGYHKVEPAGARAIFEVEHSLSVSNIDSYDPGRDFEGWPVPLGDIHPRNKTGLIDRVARALGKLAFGATSAQALSEPPLPVRARRGPLEEFKTKDCKEVTILFEMNDLSKMQWQDAPFCSLCCEAVLEHNWERKWDTFYERSASNPCAWDNCIHDFGRGGGPAFARCVGRSAPAWSNEPALSTFYADGMLDNEINRGVRKEKNCPWSGMCYGPICQSPVPFQISPEPDHQWQMDQWYDAKILGYEDSGWGRSISLRAELPDGSCASAVRYNVLDLPECLLYGTGNDAAGGVSIPVPSFSIPVGN